MRWEHYAARDHEPGQPYVVIGCAFFARLVRGVVGVSNNQRLWHDDFAVRWHERSNYIVSRRVDSLIAQRYQDGGELPEMRPVDELLGEAREMYRRVDVRESYRFLHRRLELTS